jgi:opacity protein-like surface antigen
MRTLTILLAAIAVVALGVRPDFAWADEPVGEDIVVPPPAPAVPPPPPPPPDEDDTHLYISGNVGVSFAVGEAGGRNAFFGFNNGGDDSNETAFGGGALGILFDTSPVRFRAEVEGHAARGYDFQTNFAGPVGRYDTNVNAWTIFTNLWVDYPIIDTFSVFAGGGIGAAVHDFNTNFFGNRGRSSDDAEFAWQLGAGMSFEFTDWLALDTSYRYIDMGQPDLNLNLGGDYELDLGSHDMLFGVRVTYFSF